MKRIKKKIVFRFIDALHDCEQAHAFIGHDGDFAFMCPFMDLRGKPERFGLPDNLEHYSKIPEQYILNLAMCHCGMCRFAGEIFDEMKKEYIPRESPYDVELRYWNPGIENNYRNIVNVEAVETAIKRLENIKKELKESIKEKVNGSDNN